MVPHLDRSIDCIHHSIVCISYWVWVRIWSTCCQLSTHHYSSNLLNWIRHTICPSLFEKTLKEDPYCHIIIGILKETYHHENLLIVILQIFFTVRLPLELKFLRIICFPLCQLMLILAWIFVWSLLLTCLR